MKLQLHSTVVLALLVVVTTSGASRTALAEQADRDKPINFSAEQPAEVDFQKRVGTLRGNVIITQGTITVHADKIDFKQNADNSLSATAYGDPISFRQKKDGSDEYYEGFAQRAVWDGQKNTLELFDRALLKQGTDELRSNYIWYNNASGQFKAEGRPDEPNAKAGPGSRVVGVFQPKGETMPGGKSPGTTKSGKTEPPAPLKLQSDSKLAPK